MPKTGGPRPLLIVSPIHKAGRQISLYLGAQVQGLDTSPTEAHLLTYLQLYGPCPVHELVRVFGLKNTTLTSMLDRLASRGYVARDVNPDDRRSFLISIERKGRGLATTARRFVERFDRAIRSRVSKRDLQGFRKVMDALTVVTGVGVRQSDNNRKKAKSKP